MNSINLKIEDFKPYQSKIYSVGAMLVDDTVKYWKDETGEHSTFEFDNELGEGHYYCEPGDIVLEGTKGEHWVVPASKVIGDKAKYVIDGKEIDISQIAKGHSLDVDFTKVTTKESNAITWAVQVHENNVGVVSPEGHQLIVNSEGVSHGDGDFICCADDGGKPNFEWGVWPVNGEVFENTYKDAELDYQLGFGDAFFNDSPIPSDVEIDDESFKNTPPINGIELPDDDHDTI